MCRRSFPPKKMIGDKSVSKNFDNFSEPTTPCSHIPTTTSTVMTTTATLANTSSLVTASTPWHKSIPRIFRNSVPSACLQPHPSNHHQHPQPPLTPTASTTTTIPTTITPTTTTNTHHPPGAQTRLNVAISQCSRQLNVCAILTNLFPTHMHTPTKMRKSIDKNTDRRRQK